MDKIIDGVDVSGCEFIGDIKNKFVKCTSWVHNSKKQVSGHWDCRENKNCYYKQLKRLQAEYDDLHLTYAGCKTANTGLQELNAALKAENERLKEENKHLTEKEEEAKHYLQEADKFQQCLQEIREMATLFHSVNENKGLDRFKNNILAKINEVIGAE